MPQSTAAEIPFSNLPRHVKGLKNRPQTQYFDYCPNETWTPDVNLYETDGSYLVCVDLAGVEKQEIDVTTEDHSLRIRGQRAVPAPPEFRGAPQGRLRVHLMEIDHGAFVRVVELPEDVDQAKIQATHRNGLLWIELPKK